MGGSTLTYLLKEREKEGEREREEKMYIEKQESERKKKEKREEGRKKENRETHMHTQASVVFQCNSRILYQSSGLSPGCLASDPVPC